MLSLAGERLQVLYGIAVEDHTLAILLRHRAVAIAVPSRELAARRVAPFHIRAGFPVIPLGARLLSQEMAKRVDIREGIKASSASADVRLTSEDSAEIAADPALQLPGTTVAAPLGL